MLAPFARKLLSIAGVIALCAAAAPAEAARRAPPQSHERLKPVPLPFQIPETQYEPLNWNALDGWDADDHAAAFATFLASCRPIMRATATNDTRPLRSALEAVCRRALRARRADPKRFFESNFRPVRIAKLGDSAGFLTGYYEPIVDGSRFPTGHFTVPLYRRPRDLIAPDAAPGASFPSRGRAVRVTSDGEQVPYFDRGEIEDGALDGRRLEICWIKDPIESMVIQIQGSARVRLEDGTMLRVNYDAHNGYPYTAVGRILIERKLVPREEMSMGRIREWMQANAGEAKEIRRMNRSFVFFRIVSLSNEREAIGGQGIPLTPGRSMAVDRVLHVYGTPFFIEADLQVGDSQINSFRRTMIAQDTGSAIVGPARGDLFFGAGSDAGRIAGRIRNRGRFAMLVPREIDPVAAGARLPLPRMRPPPQAAKPSAKPKKDGAKPETKTPTTAKTSPTVAGDKAPPAPARRTPAR
jgi:membrane-bound lytic murein transglycosylase A